MPKGTEEMIRLEKVGAGVLLFGISTFYFRTKTDTHIHTRTLGR